MTRPLESSIYLKPMRNSVGGDDRLQRSRLFIAIVITQIFARNKNRVSLAAQRLLTLAVRFNAQR
jgi:hypothetical protein